MTNYILTFFFYSPLRIFKETPVFLLALIVLLGLPAITTAKCFDGEAFVCDAEDTYPNFDDNLIGSTCDDNNENTENDVIQADGCAGTTSAPSTMSNASRAMYVNNFELTINDEEVKKRLLTYAQANNFDYLILYGLHLAHGQHDLTDTATNQILADFILDAKTNYGITKIGAAHGNSIHFANITIPYNESRSNPLEKIDGMVMENEFWGPTSDRAHYLDVLGYLQDMSDLADASSHPMQVDMYIGWTEEEEIQAIADVADNTFIHAYVPDVHFAFGSSASRLRQYETYNGIANVSIIFEAGARFSGPWLANNTLDEMEAIYMDNYNANTEAWKSKVNMNGFVYFVSRSLFCDIGNESLLGKACDDRNSCTDNSIYIDNSVDVDCECTGVIDYSAAAIGSMSSQLSATMNAANLTDGIKNKDNLTHTSSSSLHEWIDLDLRNSQDVALINIYNREECCSDRLTNVYVLGSNTPFPNNTDLNTSLANASFTHQIGVTTGKSIVNVNVRESVRYLRLQKSGNNPGGNAINIKEIEVYGIDDAGNNTYAKLGTACTISSPCANTALYTDCNECNDVVNLATSATGSTSSLFSPSFNAAHLTDGILNASIEKLTHTGVTDQHEWVELDLGETNPISLIKIHNRKDCCANRLSYVYVLGSNTPFPTNTDIDASLANASYIYQLGNTSDTIMIIPLEASFRYLRLQKSGSNVGGNAINLFEIEVFGIDDGDADNDGICDAEDTCPNFDNNLIGSTCDDGNPCTNNSIYTNCNCEAVTNIALEGTASMSSKLLGEITNLNNGIIVDGNNHLIHTKNDSPNEWVQIDLGTIQPIQTIKIWNRTDFSSERLSNAYVLVADSPFPSGTDVNVSLANADFTYQIGDSDSKSSIGLDVNVSGRYVRIQKSGNNPGGNAINLKELQIFGDADEDRDADNDGICDAEDTCPNFDNNLIGTACDDGDAATLNDSYNTDCNCAGENNLFKAKIFLEGIYVPETGLMRTTLNEKGLLPNSQPYNIAPWNYNGNETISNMSVDIVDWVLVMSRDENGTVLDQAVGLLTSSGDLISPNGDIGVLLKKAYKNFISIHHRSHLAVISSTPYTGNKYDFTSAIDRAAGIKQLKSVAGKYMLYAGDYDASGIINSADFNAWTIQSSIINKYLPIDGDGNSIVNAIDYNLWIKNNAKIGEPVIRY